MMKTIAINGSPRKEKGNTAMILTPFLQGMMDAGSEVVLVYTSRIKPKPCACGQMQCWYEHPGECSIKDEMQALYPKLKEADILLLATPVYIPLPGEMQNFINRLCPLVRPYLEMREGRTRAMFRDEVEIKKIVLLATGGWFEKENLGTVVRIAEELAEDASVEFAGAVLRPHAFLVKNQGEITKEGQAVLDAARRAGSELVRDGGMKKETLEEISRPLISEEELLRRYNLAL